jgi:hypothetical protein
MKNHRRKTCRGGTTKRKRDASPYRQTKRRRTRSPTPKSKSKSKSKPKQIHTVYIVAHGCHLQSMFDLPHNTVLHFNQELDLMYCGDVTTIEYNTAKYPYQVHHHSNDYFLDFVDSADELFNSFGVYLNHKMVGEYRGKKNVLLSDVVTYLRNLEPTGTLNIYCGICRTKCDTDDELLYSQMKHQYIQIDEDILDTLADL